MKETKERAIISASEDELSCGSSRGYYRAQGQVPFEWESEPGKPKNPADVDWVPPPSPSPAMQSAQLTRQQKKQKKREEKLQLSRHRSGSSLTPVEGCFLNPVRVMVCRTVKKWDLVPFFRAH
ncbi:hypothetical protein LUZ61_000185 [Rhynchospora tenuis]|uniref:Uncharacterized protein n=1 Tax=Rhynchospora tenuis TaxID=198213 RepID=A0AAD5ZET1_9POAL|nr:hypothetical protein LUZ61_000185 [Rhynchospora tenuis]